jgi:stage II sporulation protein AA (anti-sigma F factor antagonist)
MRPCRRTEKTLLPMREAVQIRSMQCTFAQDDNVLVACPSGRIDTTTYNDFKTALNAKLDEVNPRHLVVDLTGVEYVSSAGFREFFLAGRRMGRDGGSLSVCSFQPQVRELFEIAQFMTAYAVHDTREAAVAAAKAS